MKSLDFNKPFVGVDGKDTDNKLSKSLSEFLATETQGNALKLLGWVELLREGACLTLDEADEATLKQAIETSQRLTVILKGQLLRCFIKKD